MFAKPEDEHLPVHAIVLSIQAYRRVRLHEGTCVCHLVSLSLDPIQRTSFLDARSADETLLKQTHAQPA